MAAAGRARAVQEAATEAEADAARIDAWEAAKINVAIGPPGTGKTYVTHLCVQAVLEAAAYLQIAPLGEAERVLGAREPPEQDWTSDEGDEGEHAIGLALAGGAAGCADSPCAARA